VQHQLGDVAERHFRLGLVGLDDQDLAGLGDACARLLHIERQGGIGRGVERARRKPALEEAHLVGKADAGERASCAFRAVDQRRRQPAGGGREPKLGDRSARARAQLLVERDAHALARAGIPDGAFGDPVAGILEDERLGADLYPLGFVGAFGDVRPLALLGVDRRDGAIVALDQIHLGNDAEPLGAERHRARRKIRCLVDVACGRQPAAAGIDAHMRAAALLGIAGIGPFGIHPLEKGQPRAVDMLVDHAHRHQRRLAGGGRRGKLERELGGGSRRDELVGRRGRHTRHTPGQGTCMVISTGK
jgi:hypothetical protein